MFGIGSRTFYAIWHGIIFNFEYKRDKDYFIAHIKGAHHISAYDAYKSGKLSKSIRVTSSTIDRKTGRRERIKEWYENKRR